MSFFESVRSGVRSAFSVENVVSELVTLAATALITLYIGFTRNLPVWGWVVVAVSVLVIVGAIVLSIRHQRSAKTPAVELPPPSRATLERTIDKGTWGNARYRTESSWNDEEETAYLVLHRRDEMSQSFRVAVTDESGHEYVKGPFAQSGRNITTTFPGSFRDVPRAVSPGMYKVRWTALVEDQSGAVREEVVVTSAFTRPSLTPSQRTVLVWMVETGAESFLFVETYGEPLMLTAVGGSNPPEIEVTGSDVRELEDQHFIRRVSDVMYELTSKGRREYEDFKKGP